MNKEPDGGRLVKRLIQRAPSTMVDKVVILFLSALIGMRLTSWGNRFTGVGNAGHVLIIFLTLLVIFIWSGVLILGTHIVIRKLALPEEQRFSLSSSLSLSSPLFLWGLGVAFFLAIKIADVLVRTHITPGAPPVKFGGSSFGGVPLYYWAREFLFPVFCWLSLLIGWIWTNKPLVANYSAPKTDTPGPSDDPRIDVNRILVEPF